MFKKKGLINEAHKSKLKNALLDQLGLSECICLTSFKIPITFLTGRTFDEICQFFKYYLLSNYGKVENFTVVFDRGYLVFLQRAVGISGVVKKGYEEKLYHLPIIHWLRKKVSFFSINITNKHFLKCLTPNSPLWY